MATQTAFKTGQIVALKSGGPEMTVQSVPTLHIPGYRCQWFAGKKLESGSFPAESLKLVEHKAE